MTRRFAPTYAAVALVGCNVVWGVDDLRIDAAAPGGGGGGGIGGAGAQGGSNAGGQGGSGAGGSPGMCRDDIDCADGDPCTRDTCVAGICEQLAVGVGEPGTNEAPCEGTCQVDGACGLSLYERAWPLGVSLFTKTPLSVAWAGADGPPPRGILAVDHTYTSGRLLVFTDESSGRAYIRDGGGWSSDETAAMFSGVDGLAINSATFYQSASGDPDTLLLTARGSGATKLAYYFDIDDNGAVTSSPGNPYIIPNASDPDAADQESVDCDWELAVQTAFVGTPSWVVFWRSYQAHVYTFDGGDFTWDKLELDVNSELWGGDPNGPASGATRAAYYSGGTLHLVAP